jgi:hypothetical protein
MYFGSKSEAKIGAHGQARTVLSVWVGLLGCGFPIFLSTRTLLDAMWSFGSARWRFRKALSHQAEDGAAIVGYSVLVLVWFPLVWEKTRRAGALRRARLPIVIAPCLLCVLLAHCYYAQAM